MHNRILEIQLMQDDDFTIELAEELYTLLRRRYRFADSTFAGYFRGLKTKARKAEIELPAYMNGRTTT